MNDGGRAFPGFSDTYGYGDQFPVQTTNCVEWVKMEQGMSVRDYFAAKAMAALMSICPEEMTGDVARAAYTMADAMILERAKGTP